MCVAVYFWLFIVMSYVAQLATTGRTYVCCGIYFWLFIVMYVVQLSAW